MLGEVEILVWNKSKTKKALRYQETCKDEYFKWQF